MQKENGQNGRRAEDFDFCAITAPLTAWFNRVKRDLPWREKPTPYRVWVSEIMLQQTRVEAAKDYYLRFLNALPAVEDLAACDEETLMKLCERGTHTSAPSSISACVKSEHPFAVSGYAGASSAFSLALKFSSEISVASAERRLHTRSTLPSTAGEGSPNAIERIAPTV